MISIPSRGTGTLTVLSTDGATLLNRFSARSPSESVPIGFSITVLFVFSVKNFESYNVEL